MKDDVGGESSCIDSSHMSDMDCPQLFTGEQDYDELIQIIVALGTDECCRFF